MLFGETAAERGRQTGVDRSVIGEKARRFVTDGMTALSDGRSQPAVGEGLTYPEAIAGYILYLKQLYPPIHLREIERILARKFGYSTNHHTLKRFLKPYETPLQLELDDEQWVKFQQRPARTYSKRIAMQPQQLPLLNLGASALILLALKVI